MVIDKDIERLVAFLVLCLQRILHPKIIEPSKENYISEAIDAIS